MSLMSQYSKLHQQIEGETAGELDQTATNIELEDFMYLLGRKYSIEHEVPLDSVFVKL